MADSWQIVISQHATAIWSSCLARNIKDVSVYINAEESKKQKQDKSISLLSGRAPSLEISVENGHSFSYKIPIIKCMLMVNGKVYNVEPSFIFSWCYVIIIPGGALCWRYHRMPGSEPLQRQKATGQKATFFSGRVTVWQHSCFAVKAHMEPRQDATVGIHVVGIWVKWHKATKSALSLQTTDKLCLVGIHFFDFQLLPVRAFAMNTT